jgi:hypothetical protein
LRMRNPLCCSVRLCYYSIIQVMSLIFIFPFSREQHICSPDRSRTCMMSSNVI